MTVGRWLLIGLPLVLIGGAWLYFGIDPGMKQRDVVLMYSFGGGYVLAGVLATFDRRWCRVVASIAWYPLLAAVPVGTVLGIVALRLLRESGGEREEFVKAMEGGAPEEAVRILREEAMRRFGIKQEQLDVPLVAGVGIAPGEVNGFLDDLRVDYGFALEDEVDVSRASVRDMMEVLGRRVNC